MQYVKYALQLLRSLRFTTNTTIYTIFIYTPIFIFLYVCINGCKVHINIKHLYKQEVHMNNMWTISMIWAQSSTME
jgi:hypothetical protein